MARTDTLADLTICTKGDVSNNKLWRHKQKLFQITAAVKYCDVTIWYLLRRLLPVLEKCQIRAMQFFLHSAQQRIYRCWCDIKSSQRHLPCQAPTKIHTCRTSAPNRCRSQQSLLSPWGSQSNPRSRWRAQRFWDQVRRSQAQCSTART